MGDFTLIARYDYAETHADSDELARIEERRVELSNELRLMEYGKPRLPQLLNAASQVVEGTKIKKILAMVEKRFTYSMDERWLVPHFEKMLYDNALLVSVYLDAYLITKNPFYQEIAEDTLDYVSREMTGKSGEFFSTQNADSKGQEGRYYVWSQGEIKSVLGPKDGDIFCQFYGLSEAGNFEGKNILTSSGTHGQMARQLNMPPDKVELVIVEARKKIKGARELRIKP